MRASLRRFAPLILVLAGFVLFPLLAHIYFRDELPATMPALHEPARPLGNIEFQDADGQNVTLDRFRGKLILLNIWATWCVPCKTEMPSLNALASHVSAKDVAIVPVSIDVSGVAQVRRFYKEFALDSLPVFVDPASKTMHSMGVVGIPTTLLIDRAGLEIARRIGPAQWDSPQIVEGIAKLANERR
jgi:thiol-disulfide isomerase/thioredoxin